MFFVVDVVVFFCFVFTFKYTSFLTLKPRPPSEEEREGMGLIFPASVPQLGSFLLCRFVAVVSITIVQSYTGKYHKFVAA